MKETNDFELRWAIGPVDDGIRKPVRFFDFVVDGQSLWDLLDTRSFIGALGWGHRAWQDQQFKDLQLEDLIDGPYKEDRDQYLDEGRKALYVCPECGDLGCGAYTALVVRENGYVVWKDFGFDNRVEDFEPIGPFIFDYYDYVNTLQEAHRMVKEQVDELSP